MSVEGNSEKLIKIKIAKKKNEKKSTGVKLFMITKLQKHFVIVKNDKFRSLSHFMLQK